LQAIASQNEEFAAQWKAGKLPGVAGAIGHLMTETNLSAAHIATYRLQLFFKILSALVTIKFKGIDGQAASVLVRIVQALSKDAVAKIQVVNPNSPLISLLANYKNGTEQFFHKLEELLVDIGIKSEQVDIELSNKMWVKEIGELADKDDKQLKDILLHEYRLKTAEPPPDREQLVKKCETCISDKYKEVHLLSNLSSDILGHLTLCEWMQKVVGPPDDELAQHATTADPLQDDDDDKAEEYQQTYPLVSWYTDTLGWLIYVNSVNQQQTHD